MIFVRAINCLRGTIMLMKLPKSVSQATVALISLGGLLVVLVSTRPSEDNFGLSFVPLLFLWVLLYSGSGLLMRVVFRTMRSSLSQMIRIAGASSVVLTVMFNALGQLSTLDVVVLLLLVTLGSFYFSRTWRV